ncbi:MAG: flagellar filament protein FlaA [Treponema sp.]|nr:flagellar filament protein FlaA [Treponema sp.]
MKKIILALMIIFCATMIYAQDQYYTSASDPDPNIIGADSARLALREVSVEMFEREGSWNARISPDDGVITARLFDGGPSAKEPLAETEKTNAPDVKVLGVKAQFFRRGVNSFYITSARPIPIEGITKTVSIWVVGRNKPHKLNLLVQDYFGNNFELYMGELQFSGWKKMTVAVPPSPDGEHGIIQTSAYHGDRPGLRIIGFRVDCNPMDARGSYYIYFDDMRAVTDLYDIENRDEDDMNDNW